MPELKQPSLIEVCFKPTIAMKTKVLLGSYNNKPLTRKDHLISIFFPKILSLKLLSLNLLLQLKLSLIFNYWPFWQGLKNVGRCKVRTIHVVRCKVSVGLKREWSFKANTKEYIFQNFTEFIQPWWLSGIMNSKFK